MIQSETISNDLIRHYSDAGLRIEQIETGRVYDDAVDTVPCEYTYRETTEGIEAGDDTEELQARLEDAETAVKILMGEEQ